jgi:hypothetical protein
MNIKDLHYKMMHQKEELKGGVINVSDYNANLENICNEYRNNLTDKEKAEIFDSIFKYSLNNLTRQEEFYDDGFLYWDSDWVAYEWEHTQQALFGDNFFEFYNNLYEGC